MGKLMSMDCVLSCGTSLKVLIYYFAEDLGKEFGTTLAPVALDVPLSTEVYGLKLMACKARAT
jgi:hypothetical protein